MSDIAGPTEWTLPKKALYIFYIVFFVRRTLIQINVFTFVANHVNDFNNRIEVVTAKLLTQGVINFGKLFQNFTAETPIWLLNIKLAWEHFCNKEYIGDKVLRWSDLNI